MMNMWPAKKLNNVGLVTVGAGADDPLLRKPVTIGAQATELRTTAEHAILVTCATYRAFGTQ